MHRFSQRISRTHCTENYKRMAGNQCRKGFPTNPKINAQSVLFFQVERIIFCTYEQRDWDIYSNLLHSYFPIPDKEGI